MIDPEREVAADDDCQHVLVIGAANLDIKGQPEEPPVSGSSVPGLIRSSLGGVARNIADNLTRLEVDTVLLTAVADDDRGERILGHAAGLGIDITEALVVEGQRTGAYMAMLQEGGGLNFAIDDMNIMSYLTPSYLRQRKQLFDDACLVFVDANLKPDSLAAVVDLCDQADVALCADPSATTLAHRLRPHLAELYMLVPNVAEAAILTDHTFTSKDRDEALVAASHLVDSGVEMAIVTLGEYGVVYDDGLTKGHIPAIQTPIVDETGAGDAMTAATMFGLLENIPLDESLRLGVTAASLTLRTQETVRSDLSVELLYNELII